MEKYLPDQKDVDAIRHAYEKRPDNLIHLCGLALSLDPSWYGLFSSSLHERLTASRDPIETWYQLVRHPVCLTYFRLEQPDLVARNVRQAAKATLDQEEAELNGLREKLTVPRPLNPLDADKRSEICFDLLKLLGRVKDFEGSLFLAWLKQDDYRLLDDTCEYWETTDCNEQALLSRLNRLNRLFPDRARKILGLRWATDFRPRLERMGEYYLEHGDDSLAYFGWLKRVADISPRHARSVIKPAEWQKLLDRLEQLREHDRFQVFESQVSVLGSIADCDRLYEQSGK